jgi:uncharacterized protein (TIGR03437 family)
MGVIASAVHAQSPAPGGVVSSASFALAGLPNGAIAQGSIFTVFGKNMGPATLVQNTSSTLPTTTGLSGTTVTITVNNVTTTAPMVYTSAGQLAAILPSTTPVGTGTLTVAYFAVSGTPIPITVVASNFSMFTLNGSGTGPAIVTDNNSLITTTNSAQAGDVVVLYGTGLGPLPSGQNDASNPPVQVNLTSPITVYVGTTSATVAYHGRSGDAGLDQINFTIPTGLSGCNIPVIVQVGTGATAVTSNSATISVAATRGTTCSDSTGVPLSSVTPNSNGTVAVGSVALEQITSTIPGVGTQTSSIGTANFEQYSAQQITTAGSLSGQPSLGGCVVNYYNVGSSSTTIPTAAGLNAGSVIAVTGPATLNLTPPTTGVAGLYSSVLQSSLPAGNYTITGSGGTNVGAFTTTITLPPALTWTNSTSTITRSAGLTVNWTGGSSNGFVLIEGASTTGATSGVGALFLCIAPNTGSFAVPSAVLLSLPPSVTVSGVPTGSFIVGSFTNPQTFTATGLNYGYANAGSLTSALVSYQ